MGGWIFILCMVLLIPLTMIIWGKRAINYEAKDKFDMSKFRRKINIKGKEELLYLTGYRTRRSMKNDETFRFAQKLFGIWWYKLGLINLLPSVFAMYLVIHKNKNIIGLTGLIIVLIQCIVMCIPIIPIEKALKKNFDGDGNKIIK